MVKPQKLENQEIPASAEEYVRLAGDPNLLHLIGMMGRIGVYYAIRRIELQMYRPGTPDNDNYMLGVVEWEQMKWALMTVPLRDRARVEAIVKDCHMRIADGTPHTSGSARIAR